MNQPTHVAAPNQNAQQNPPSPPQQPAAVRDFDPFEFMSLYRGIKNKGSARLGIVGLVIIALIIIPNLADGTFGTIHDFHLWSDIQRPFGATNLPASPPSFPLMRDVTTWFLAFTTIFGTILLHQQWTYLSKCLSTLVAHGAIVPLAAPRSNMLSRVLRIDAMTRGVPPADALNAVVGKVVDGLARKRRILFPALAIISIVLALLLQAGQQNDLFETFAPPHETLAQNHAWLAAAYQNWWAGDAHLFGHIVYTILAIYAILIILHFEVVGIIAIYMTIAVYFTVDFSADWLNLDGRFGWSPIARTFRTVLWANALLGGTLAVVLMSIGFSNYRWVSVLVVLYAIFMPMFTLVPWLVFRRVENQARKLRVRRVSDLIEQRGLDVDRDIKEIAPYIAEITRCQAIRIRPLRMGTASLSTYVVVVILPIILAAAQIIVPLRYSLK
jgi:hypothetical protein